VTIFARETGSTPEAVRLRQSWPGVDLGTIEAISRVALELRTQPEWLAAIINAESGFNPRAVNSHTGATGLIQFMPATAERLGTSTAELAELSAEDQLEWVKAYFWPYRGKLGTAQSVYLSVFYPVARSWHPDRPFPAAVRAVNPFTTPREYTEWVDKRARGRGGVVARFGLSGGHDSRGLVVPGAHFAWHEFERRGEIPPELEANTEGLVRYLLEPLRMELLPDHGLPITSGYRSPEYNAYMLEQYNLGKSKYKPSTTSLHMQAAAADAEPRSASGVSNRDMVTWWWLLRDRLPIQQAIVETHTGHAHIAYGPTPSRNGQFLIGPGKNLKRFTPSSADVERVTDRVRRSTGRGVGETAGAWLGGWSGPIATPGRVVAGGASGGVERTGGTGGGGGGIILLIPVALLGLGLMSRSSR